MRIQFRKHWSLAGAALLCFAAGAFAQNTASMPAPGGVRSAITQSLAPAAAHSAASSKATESGKVSQKLFIFVPETPSILIFAADLAGLAGLAFLFRRRLFGQGATAGIEGVTGPGGR